MLSTVLSRKFQNKFLLLFCLRWEEDDDYFERGVSVNCFLAW